VFHYLIQSFSLSVMIQTIASTSEDYLVLYSIEKCTKRLFYIVSSQAATVAFRQRPCLTLTLYIQSAASAS